MHAKLGPSEGEDAFYELLRWKDGEFTIEHSVDTYKKTIEGDAMFLVFEGLRRADEQALAAS